MRRGFVNMQRGLVGCLVLALTAGPLPAREPSNLADLAYQDSKWAQSELRKRGYTLQDRDHHGGAFFQYWWKERDRVCVQVKHEDGKVVDIDTTSSSDCNQYDGWSDDDSGASKSDSDDAAAVAVAAAAIIGAAALAHKSHHRDGKHGDNAQSQSEFERGYRDGLYREDYHNYNDTESYTDGYDAGVDERRESTRHRSHHSGHGSGYRPHVSVNDLIGARAAGAESDLESRGFRSTGSYKQGQRSMVTWYNSRTHQCIEVATAGGRIDTIENIAEGNCQ